MIATWSMAQFVVDRCEITPGWESDNVLTVERTDKKEGLGALSFSGTGTKWFSKKYAQIQSGVDENGFLSFWLYISDASTFSGSGFVELNSSATEGTDAYRWSIQDLGLTAGWNELNLTFTTAQKIGTPDLSAVRGFIISQALSRTLEARLDGLKLRNSLASSTPQLLDIKTVDPTTLDGKVMFGYQGWFSSPGDGTTLGDRYHHWGDLGPGEGKQSNLSIEMWFDDREFDPDELYPTGYRYPDGREARSFSSGNKKTVLRHMKWLRDYDLDGVFLQRFMSEARDPKYKTFRDTVAIHVKDGCERYGRTFAMMWDGLNYSGAAEDIKNDWMHLVDDLKLTESQNYLHHRGKPLISLWGYTVRDEAKLEELEELIEFFHNNPEEKYRASIKLGCNDSWRTRGGGMWQEAFSKVEVISPWTVGRYGSSKEGYENFANRTTVPDMVWCNERNIDYLPVNWPGFSWFNLHDGPKNQHPRRNGDFFWEQASGNISRGAKSLYVAMFDEIDEATAFFKLPENKDMSPDKGYWLSLDADGKEIPSDWYLRAVSLVTEVVRGEEENREFLETPPDGIDAFSLKANHATCSSANGSLKLGYPSGGDAWQFSIDGGQSYSFSADPAAASLTVENLEAGLYNVWVKYADGSLPTDLGDVLIVDSSPEITLEKEDASCLADGVIHISVGTNPYLGAVSISLDGGATYGITLEEGVYQKTLEGLAEGQYDVWARWESTTCSRAVGVVDLAANVPAPSIKPEVFDEPATGSICPGSSLSLAATVDDAVTVTTWQWSGPAGFEANTAEVSVTEKLTQAEAGTYTVTYTDTKGCSASESYEVILSEGSVPEIAFQVEAEGQLQNPVEVVFCEGERLILEATPNESAFTYEWEGPNGFRKSGRRATLSNSASSDLNGTYLLKVTNGDCFAKLEQVISVGVAGECGNQVLGTQTIKQIQIFPNPGNGKYQLVGESDLGPVKLTDFAGKELNPRLLQTGNESFELDIREQPKGIYLLYFTTHTNESHSIKLVKH